MKKLLLKLLTVGALMSSLFMLGAQAADPSACFANCNLYRSLCHGGCGSTGGPYCHAQCDASAAICFSQCPTTR